MACDITAGRNDSNCLDSLGGIKAIYIANVEKRMFADATFTGEEITAMGADYDVFKY